MPKVNFLDLMRSHNKSYEDIFIAKGLSSEDMFGFSDIVETQEENQGLRTFGKKSHNISRFPMKFFCENPMTLS